MIKKLIFRTLGVLVTLGIGLPLILFVLVYNDFFGHVPDETEIQNIHNLEASVVFDSNGESVGKFYLQDRTPVEFNEISPFLVKALVATEDKRFYNHNGIDFKSLLRVVFKTILLQKSSSGGGSTITLQLAKNLYPRSSYKLLYYPINKTKEAIVAYRIEKEYSKEQILSLYLNTVSFGSDIYGVQSAADRYFNTTALELGYHQSATLVGMLKATTSYNPVLHPEASRNRRNVVFSQMAKAEELSSDEADSLSNLPLDVDYQPKSKQLAPYYLARVKRKLNLFIADYNKNNDVELNLLTDGLKIYTSLNKNMQRYAEAAMDDHMVKLQKIFDKHWHDQDLWAKHNVLLDREIKAVANGRSPKEMQEARKMFVFDHLNPETREMSPIDSIKYYLQQLQAGFLAIQPNTGAIKVWVGGIDHQFFPYDHVNINARRQVGSTFKPIVYATALENGISPCNYYQADQEAYEVKEGEWKPANDNANYDGKYTMEGALEKSVNTVSVKILNDVGVEKAVDLAHQMGIEAYIPSVPSIALGTPSISLLEMVTAYAAFSNGGYSVSPYMIERIEDKHGNILYQHSATEPRRVISDKTSGMMAHLLQGVVDDGTARSLRTVYQLKNKIGGKTGTTQNNADGWFMAITPKLVAGAWVGGIYPEISFTDTRLGQGATMALPIFAKFYKSLNSDLAYSSYTQANFRPLQEEWIEELDCDPFREDFNLRNWLFGSDDERKKKNEDQNQKKEKEGVFKKLKKLFKKE